MATVRADTDSGALHYLENDGRLYKTLKLGEHISDIYIENENIYAAVYNDNKIVKVINGERFNEVYTNYFPQKIIADKFVFALFTDGEYCYVERFDSYLKKEKTLKILFDFFEFYKSGKYISCLGEKYFYLLDINLKIRNLKKI